VAFLEKTMIIDKSLQFDSASAVTVTAPSANTIDLGCNRDIGIDNNSALALVCLVTTAFTAAGAATLTVQFQTSADNASWTTLVQSDVLAVATLTSGAEIMKTKVPMGCQRYLRLNYVVATGPMTAGTITSQIVLDRQANPAYASGFTVAA
jgi:hypothetical protein